MSYKVIVVSPDSELVNLLQDALTNPAVGAEPTVVSSYPTPDQVRRFVENGRDPITAFIVGLSDRERALDLIRDLRASHPQILAVAASTASSADAILAAMRAGASEFLVPPLDLKHLEQCFRAQRKSAIGDAYGKLLCFIPAQGGNGASTVAMHVADATSRSLKEKVLVVDFDFHSGTLAFRLRLKPEFTFADAIARIEDIDELWERLTANWNGLDILSSPPRGSSLPANAFQQTHTIFRSAVRHYPYVIADLPTALYSSCHEIVGMADAVYVVSTPEVVSLHLARRRVSELLDLGVKHESIHLVLNRVGSKKTLNVGDVAEVVGIPVFASLCNDYAGVSDAALKGGLVPKDSNLGREIRNLAQQIVGSPPEGAKPAAKKRGFLPF
jgi:Flp pilus assembly CpaE family ATPase